MYYSYGKEYRRNRSNFEKSKETNGFKGWRRAQYEAQHGHCAWCYEKIAYENMDVDHIAPLGVHRYDIDLNDFDNLVLACHECNRDIKKDTTYNEIAYERTLNKLSLNQKQDGLAPKKLYWERPEWIGPNKYSHSYKDYKPVDIPESERNVWEQESPLVRDYSLKTSNIDYAKSLMSDNSEVIWKIIKWVLIGIVVFIVLTVAGNIAGSKKNTTTTKYCDFECQEAGRMKYEAEEEKKRQKEREEEYEEARRYWNCRNAGGSDYDCG